MRTLCLLAAAGALASAQQKPEILLRQDFENQSLSQSPGQSPAWMSMSPGATVRIDHDPSHVHAGHGALAFSYEVKPRQAAAAVLPAPPVLARLARLHFWLKTDHATPVTVLLSEKKPGGGNYNAVVWSPAETWQEIALAPSDFFLADGPNDPQDSDGKLDLDQLQGIGLIDMAAFLPALAGASPNPHTLWIDDFEALGGEPAPSPSPTVDDFARGYLAWLTTTGADLKLQKTDNPLHEPAMQASYEETDDPFPAFVRRVDTHGLAPATRLEFDIASEKEATINVSLEMRKPGAQQGPRFNLPIYPPPERELFHVSLKLADFQGPGKLDPAQLKSLVLVDVSAAGSGSLGRNTFWVGNVRFR